MNVEKQQILIQENFEEIVEKIFLNRNNDAFYHKGVFNTKDLPDHKKYTYSANLDSEFSKNVFSSLDKIKSNHCLYWFELPTAYEAEQLNDLIDVYRQRKGENDYRVVPASNKNTDSRILYLGTRRGGFTKSTKLTNITGRICQHLGYYEKGTTQGLQLYEYAKAKDFEVTLKVIEFENLETYSLNVIEKLLAKKLKPLSGRQ